MTTATVPPSPAALPVTGRRQTLIAHLTHRPLRPGQACPVTLPNPRAYKPRADLRSVLNGDLRDIYGHGAMAVILPAGRINVSREPHRGWYRDKVAWWVDVPGALHITARRLDRYSATLDHGDVAPPAPTGAHRIEPTNVLFPVPGCWQVNVLFPVPGCWQVAGGVGSDVLTWIFRARA